MSALKQQRKIMFFLGAGASYAAGAVATVQRGGRVPIPTQASFWSTFLRFAKSKHNEKLIASFLFRYFLGFARTPARLTPVKRRESLEGIDVEEVFTFLSERIRAPGTSPQVRVACNQVWEALLTEVAPVFQRFKANSSTRGVYRALLHNQIRVRDPVVSFNYDTVFEDSLPKNRKWHYEGIDQETGSLRVLKPHGSWNWESGEEIKISRNPAQAVVVAPTHLKFVRAGLSVADTAESAGYLDQSTQIQEIWHAMEQEMRQAKALVFIGYSFPSGDLYFSSVLRSVLASRQSTPAVVIVNPDALAIEKRLQGRFALGDSAKYFGLESFADVKREQLLSALH